MPRIDLHALTRQVRTILAEPGVPPPSGDAALDSALATLARKRRQGQPLAIPRFGFWERVPEPHRSRA